MKLVSSNISIKNFFFFFGTTGGLETKSVREQN